MDAVQNIFGVMVLWSSGLNMKYIEALGRLHLKTSFYFSINGYTTSTFLFNADDSEIEQVKLWFYKLPAAGVDHLL